ncbi:MAG: peptidoglycan editing factor PgeF [Bacteroidia bacterium]
MSIQTLTSKKLKTTHGFFTRHGGISAAPFDALNLGGQEDDPEHILHNRKLALAHLGSSMEQLAYLKQIHGNIVCDAAIGQQTGDALVTNKKGIALAISTADCYPILFHDAVHGVVGAAHAGWRGTVSRIVLETIAAMCALGASRTNIAAVIGPGISQQHYEVGKEVMEQFVANGFPQTIFAGRNLDLAAANKFVLMEAGIEEDNIELLNRCTTEPDFFSYRRDAGRTGRMWNIIML